MVLAHPRVEVFLTNPLEICCTGDLDVVLCLEDVDSVEKVDESKALQWDGRRDRRREASRKDTPNQ